MTLTTTSEKLFFFKFPVFLFSLIPFFLITGPLLSDLSISIICVLFIIYCFKKKNFSYFKNYYFYFFLIFWIYLIINSLINNINFDSLKISIFYIRYGIFVIGITTYLKYENKFLNYFFYCIFFCFIILVLDGFYQYFFGENIIGLKKTFRTSSFFGEEKILGSYLSRLWPLFFGISLLVIKSKNFLFFSLILIFILTEVLIFLSGDRTAFFYVNLSAIFVIIFSKKLFKLRILILICSIALLIIISYINPTAKQRVIDQTIDQMNLKSMFSNSKEDTVTQKKDLDTIYIFTIEHTHHYISAYKMFLDNKILGVGVKNFRNFCKEEKYRISNFSCSSHPHNTYVQILTETGIIGFLFIVIILIYFFIKIFIHFLMKLKKRYHFSDFEICILSAIAIYLFPFVPTGNVFNNWLNIIMILNLPFLLWSLELKNSTIKER